MNYNRYCIINTESGKTVKYGVSAEFVGHFLAQEHNNTTYSVMTCSEYLNSEYYNAS